MTETDATRRPLGMPEKFLPYLDRFRLYHTFKDMTRDLLLNLPKDHLKHLKTYLVNQMNGGKDIYRVIMLVSPELSIDKKKIVREIIKDLGFAVITRQIVMDFYVKHDDYVKGCVSPTLLATVTKNITLKEPVPQTGWLMLEHPCSMREARCLQQAGVLPSVTLMLVPPPPAAEPPPPRPPRPHMRSFHDQDIDALRIAYKATLKEVIVNPDEPLERVAEACFNAIRACIAGAQHAGQGHHVSGAPGVYRVLVVGPRGAGRRTQASMLAKHFNLVHVSFQEVYREATLRKDDLADKLQSFGPTPTLLGEIVNRRILQKDCLDHGWVMTGYPNSGTDFEILDGMKTPPNRVIFLNLDWETCKSRVLATGIDWCTGRVTAAPGPRVRAHPRNNEIQVDKELELYFTETLAELRAAAGITAVEVDASVPPDQVQVQIQAGVIAALAFDIERCCQIRNMAADEASLLLECVKTSSKTPKPNLMV